MRVRRGRPITRLLSGVGAFAGLCLVTAWIQTDITGLPFWGNAMTNALFFMALIGIGTLAIKAIG
jgi:hypothetical protein